MHKQIEGFILSGKSFEYKGASGLKLYGQSDFGPFLVTINHFQNYFFKECQHLGSFKSLDGLSVEKIFCHSHTELMQKMKRYEESGLRTYEADVRPLERYLMDQGIYAQVTISGGALFKNGIWTFVDPKIEKGNYYPQCRIFSFDIETGKDGRLYSLAYSFHAGNSNQSNEDQVFMLGEDISNEQVKFCKSERDILLLFQEAMQRLDPDIVTGWNVIGFDFHFLEKKSHELKTPLILGRNSVPFEMYQNARQEWKLNVEGRAIAFKLHNYPE